MGPDFTFISKTLYSHMVGFLELQFLKNHDILENSLIIFHGME